LNVAAVNPSVEIWILLLIWYQEGLWCKILICQSPEVFLEIFVGQMGNVSRPNAWALNWDQCHTRSKNQSSFLYVLPVTKYLWSIYLRTFWDVVAVLACSRCRRVNICQGYWVL